MCRCLLLKAPPDKGHSIFGVLFTLCNFCSITICTLKRCHGVILLSSFLVAQYFTNNSPINSKNGSVRPKQYLKLPIVVQLITSVKHSLLSRLVYPAGLHTLVICRSRVISFLFYTSK